jgi:hypothetical protein
MTPEEQRALFDLLEGMTRIETKLDGLNDRFGEHESADDEAHARIGGLEKHQTRLYAIWAAAIVIVPAVSWFLVVVGKTGTH